jgi:hypothetical protein
MRTIQPIPFRSVVRQAIYSEGVSQRWAALQAGIRPSHLCSWLRGGKNIGCDALARLLAVLELRVTVPALTARSARLAQAYAQQWELPSYCPMCGEVNQPCAAAIAALVDAGVLLVRPEDPEHSSG